MFAVGFHLYELVGGQIFGEVSKTDHLGIVDNMVDKNIVRAFLCLPQNRFYKVKDRTFINLVAPRHKVKVNDIFVYLYFIYKLIIINIYKYKYI